MGVATEMLWSGHDVEYDSTMEKDQVLIDTTWKTQKPHSE